MKVRDIANGAGARSVRDDTHDHNRSDSPKLNSVFISQVSNGGPVTEIAEGNWNNRYPGTNQANYPFDPGGCGPYDCNLFEHSIRWFVRALRCVEQYARISLQVNDNYERLADTF